MKIRSYRFAPPPRILLRAQLDNLALVPASLLPLKAEWQAVANELPKGTTLIILPSTDTPLRKTLVTAAAVMKSKGLRVMTLPAKRFS